ncbi:6-phosphogluconolactonase [Qipengyuania atrilutea]|uniref:6-phosphogluconolactonase n=1 Tax=Qipengyuania atrilutea TaxID=2744473 RepID=A0A850H6E4_9SPHN|nr:6-phosphogluconolactonase [Actirhodobacter atriluteus]NVD45732.1 6-phosphogluconolactonase [Actirhodobacter atriluteus]
MTTQHDNIEIRSGASDAEIASWLHAFLSAALERNDGMVAITMPGGSTPFPIVEALIAHDRSQRESDRLPFDRLTVWPGDDRVVPEDHDASNTGKIRALFEPLGAAVVALNPMEKVPHFALTWLGMGADGHIASLFPNTDPKADDPQKVRTLTPDPLPPEAPFDRITLTIPALLDSDHVMFVIRGEDKRAVFGEAVAGKSDLPIARLLSAAKQPVTCFS